jgi:hypothetical protein
LTTLPLFAAGFACVTVDVEVFSTTGTLATVPAVLALTGVATNAENRTATRDVARQKLGNIDRIPLIMTRASRHLLHKHSSMAISLTASAGWSLKEVSMAS